MYCQCSPECGTIWQSVVDLPGTTTLEKTGSSSARNHQLSVHSTHMGSGDPRVPSWAMLEFNRCGLVWRFLTILPLGHLPKGFRFLPKRPMPSPLCSQIARTWKQPRCPPADEGIMKTIRYTIELHSAVQNVEIMAFAGERMARESSVLRGVL